MKVKKNKLNLALFFIIIIELLVVIILKSSTYFENKEQIEVLQNDINVITKDVKMLSSKIQVFNNLKNFNKNLFFNKFKKYNFVFNAGISKSEVVDIAYSSEKNKKLYKVDLYYYATSPINIKRLLFILKIDPQIKKIIDINEKKITVLMTNH